MRLRDGRSLQVPDDSLIALAAAGATRGYRSNVISLSTEFAMTHSWYDILHDFAGSVATIAAAIAALIVTWHFGSRQAAIAEQQAKIANVQANTALDRLRYDLFEKRYQIYDTAKQLMRVTINDSRKPSFGAHDVIPLSLILDEAPFFFPASTCTFLDSIREDCQKLIVANAEGQNPNYTYSQAEEAEIRSLTRRLVNTLTSMPKRFEADLRFSQLTQPTAT
jgi:type II secretory pathway pseudopilin PulG